MNANSHRPNLNTIPEGFIIAKEFVYNQCGFECTDPVLEAESKDYAACTFMVNGLVTRYRTAKITPAKMGQFVTLWKRNNSGPIEPFDIADDIDLIVIGARKELCYGQFVFPLSVLLEKGIVSGENKPGKRGFRVYPPWDVATSMQARKTQQWQVPYFLEISGLHLTDLTLANKLYASTSFK